MATPREPEDRQADFLPASLPLCTERPLAWEQIEEGRFQPRRIRGSYHGRELG